MHKKIVPLLTLRLGNANSNPGFTRLEVSMIPKRFIHPDDVSKSDKAGTDPTGSASPPTTVIDELGTEIEDASKLKIEVKESEPKEPLVGFRYLLD